MLLIRRRGQAKQAIVDMVQLVMNSYMPDLKASRVETFNMLTTLREVTEGKMILEREYATCTRQLVEMYEQDGKIDEACKMIQEIQIETYGSMQNKEKVDFILYQMKLVLQRQDYVRLQILSKKISKKSIDEAGLETSKILYYRYLVRYYVHEKDLFAAAKAYQTIYDALNKAASDDKLIEAMDQSGQERKLAFQNFVLYLLVSTYTNEKVDLLNKVEANYARELDTEPIISKLVRKLLTFELMPMDEKEIEAQLAVFEPFSEATRNAKQHMRDLIRQLIQHNLRVIEKYYSRIRLSRLAELVGVSHQRAEQEICDMVVKKLVSAKINRLEGVVAFNQKRRTANEQLSAWNNDIKTTLELVESTCHLINRDIITEKA